MKKITLSLICLFTFSLVYSQHIQYQKTLGAALAQAAKSKKLVFINLYIPSVPGHPALKTALTYPNVAKLYNANFINYSLKYTDTAATALRKKYKTTGYPAYLFIDTLGNLVYKETGAYTLAAKYLTMSKKALVVQASGRTLSNYMARYSRTTHINNTDTSFLKDYITLREELGYEDNAELIDRYVNFLRITNVLDYKTVLFILKAGPLAYGQTYNLCYLDKKITDSLYKTEPLALRTLINNRIIDNTMNNAIANKNLVMAQQGARFAAATWAKSNPKKGVISSAGKMLNYYWGVKDTAAYFRAATNFYNQYYMNISADSAIKVDQEYLKSLNAAATYPVTSEDRVASNSTQSNVVTFHRVSNVLNSVAYAFYTLGTHNQTYLATAMLWSKRAIELYPVYHNYDTLAHLLYRLGLFEEAISTQNKAVKLAVKNNAIPNELKYLKTEQHKIKDHLL